MFDRADKRLLGAASAGTARLWNEAEAELLLPSGRRALDLALLVAGVPVERARRRELTELVPDHVLGDEHRHEFTAVVHGECKPDCVGSNGRAPRPGLDDLLALGGNGV